MRRVATLFNHQYPDRYQLVSEPSPKFLPYQRVTTKLMMDSDLHKRGFLEEIQSE